MKRLLMVLFAAGIVSAVSAQPGNSKRHNDDGYSHNSGRSNSQNYSKALRERDLQIQMINRDFDQQIRSVRFDRFMRPAQKNRRIKMLEKQRAQQCSIVMERFSKTARYGNDYARNNKRF